jgi:hypothetical protein
MEHQGSVVDVEAAQYFFSDLADANESTHTVMEAKYMMPSVEGCPKLNLPGCSVIVCIGTQVQPHISSYNVLCFHSMYNNAGCIEVQREGH